MSDEKKDVNSQQENVGKKSINKKLIIAFAGMGAVIVGLVIALILVATSGKKDVDSSASKAESSSAATSETDDTSEEDSVADESEDESDADEEESKDDKKEKGFIISYSGDNSWQDGDKVMTGMEIGIENNSDEALKECGSTSIGCNIGTGTKLNVKSAKLNGVECIVKKGKVSQNNNNNNNNQNNDKKVTEKDVKKLLKRTSKAKQGDDWLHTDGSKILDKDGKEVWLTGVNWFGYNTGTNTFDGLWNSELVSSVEAIADHGFNLIRVPMSAELINQWSEGEYPKANYNNAYNEELNSMNSLEIFDYFLKLAEENGLKVMPDIHSAETNASGHTVNLWYTDKVTVKDYYHALEWLADRYKDNDTIVAFDLKNEPHGKPNEGDAAAIWNDSKDANNWKYVAETAASKVLAKNPNVLIMVEGIEIYPKNIKKNGDYSSTNSDDYYFNWWGGNLRGVKDYPIDLGKYQDKLVYSPHDYGPTVYQQPWFEGDYTYKSLMKDCWKDNWFYIQKQDIAPLLIGEWGGFMTEPNLTWMTYMRKLIKDNHVNHTFWCFNANSGDTGGLVKDDFVTWDEEKYDFVKEVLWQEGGKFVGLDHAIPLGDNGITLKKAKGL